MSAARVQQRPSPVPAYRSTMDFDREALYGEIDFTDQCTEAKTKQSGLVDRMSQFVRKHLPAKKAA